MQARGLHFFGIKEFFLFFVYAIADIFIDERAKKV